jgi:glutathione S-transferase
VIENQTNQLKSSSLAKLKFCQVVTDVNHLPTPRSNHVLEFFPKLRNLGPILIMTLKIHGHPQSTSTRRVLLVLKEKKIPYELVSIDWAVGEHRQPEWLQFHPFAEIPYINDDGFILYESRAIARYLVAAYPEDGPALVPAAGAGVKAHALFEQAMAVEGFKFDPIVSGILSERLEKP